MKLLLSFLFALLMLTGALKAEARSLTPIEGLEALRRSFGTMQDFTADLTQEKQLSIMKKKTGYAGTDPLQETGPFLHGAGAALQQQGAAERYGAAATPG